MLSQISKPILYKNTEILVDEKYRPWLPIPLSLFNLTGNIVDNFPLPYCWYWDTNDVINWLQKTICLPQYTECFTKNFINGRRLLLIDASKCIKIGIQNFGHIKLITNGIRKLYNIEQERFNRSISLPPRYSWTHYLLYKIPTGPIREKTKSTELFQKMGILHFKTGCRIDHWRMMLCKWPDFPNYLFGLTNRKNVYIKNEQRKQ
ncbi:sterile alpha motif domain-containing protein 15-like [Polistes fuscatus]|uniref:sterile alpha motif domain-containing protein 15-like n=1 Tax=Polistes fuscatus TaxID=30207 RepID=UPI001CA8A152|nr:sterile alpha motif domain-containing protein 15-like [Polistes fuscatus]